MPNTNERVIAISHVQDKTVYFFGYGVYEGDFVPTPDAGGLAKILAQAGRKNPRIRLDSGKVVWGCECWWGSEEAAKKNYEKCKFVEVSIDDARKA